MIITWPGWQSVRLLGEGSFGKVYEIRREEFGHMERAALKVITIPRSPAEVESAYQSGMDEKSVTNYFHSFVEELVSEFALMHQLKSNNMNIVGYEDHMVVQHEDGIGWDILIRMELLEPLTKYVASHPLSEQEVIALGRDICRALAVCREKGILHRDIKPDNIFYSQDTGYFKLGDFGIARIAEKTSGNYSTKGTINYMAPEVYTRQAYGFAADMYSLGLVLYSYLNDGRRPFLPDYPNKITFSDNETALRRRMEGEALPEPKHGSPKLKQAVLKACAFKAEDRFATPMEFFAALDAAAGEYDADASQGAKTFGGTIGIFGAAAKPEASEKAAADGQERGTVWQSDVHGISMKNQNSKDASRKKNAAAFNQTPENASNKKKKSGSSKIFIGIGVGAVVIIVLLIVVMMAGGSGSKKSSSSSYTSSTASTESSEFDRDYYYSLLKSYGLNTSSEASEELTEGLVDTLYYLDQGSEASWDLDASSAGYSLSSAMQRILLNVYDEDHESMRADILAAMEKLSDQKTASSSGDSSDNSDSSVYEADASEFRDVYEEVVEENKGEEAVNAVSEIFDEEGVTAVSEFDAAMAQLEYYQIVTALKEMDLTDMAWTAADVDHDGMDELLITCMYDNAWPVGMLADAGVNTFWSWSIKGASQDIGYFISTEDYYVLFIGAYSAMNQAETISRWNGSDWTDIADMYAEVVEQGNEWVQDGSATVNGETISLDEYDAAIAALGIGDEAEFDNPVLNTVTLKGDPDMLINKLEVWLTENKTVNRMLTDDTDGDGNEETVYLISGSMQNWFDGIVTVNDWGDEPFLSFTDSLVTSYVVSETDNGIEISVTRLPEGADTGEEPSTESSTSTESSSGESSSTVLEGADLSDMLGLTDNSWNSRIPDTDVAFMIDKTWGEIYTYAWDEMYYYDSFDYPGEWFGECTYGNIYFYFNFEGTENDLNAKPVSMYVYTMAGQISGYDSVDFMGGLLNGFTVSQAQSWADSIHSGDYYFEYYANDTSGNTYYLCTYDSETVYDIYLDFNNSVLYQISVYKSDLSDRI